MKTAKSLCVVVLGMFLLAGCATTQPAATTPATWGQQATVGYELTGATLQTAKSLLDVACEGSLIAPDKCAQYVVIYNKASAAYLVVGDALKAAIVITDAAKQQTAIQTYYTALAQLTPLAGEVTTMIQALKVK